MFAGEDAVEAIKAGCSAVYVSNHGGRQLDGVYSSVSKSKEYISYSLYLVYFSVFNVFVELLYSSIHHHPILCL